MHLKESAYNFIYDDLGKDQIVFYNSRTGALAVVHEDQYKQYKGFQEKGKEIEDAEFLKNLLKCGYQLNFILYWIGWKLSGCQNIFSTY